MKYTLNNFIVAILALLLFSPRLDAQQEILLDEIIAVVGDNIILKSEIEVQVIQAQAQGYMDDDIACQVLDQLLLEKMFVAQAVIDSVIVEPLEVEGEIARRLDYFQSLFPSQEAMEEYYGRSLLQMKEDFREDVQNQLLAQRMKGQITSGVQVTPSEVKAFFDAIPVDSLPYYNAEIELGQLIIEPEITRKHKETAKNQLRDIKKRIEAGEPFEQLAAIYSEDPGSKVKGGDLGWQRRGTFVPEFEGAAFKLQKGELSGIVESDFGFHLIQLLERQGDRIHTRHILLKPVFSQEDMDKAASEIDSIRNLIVSDTLGFIKAVADFSDDEATAKTGGFLSNPQTGSVTFQLDQLDPNIYFAVESLQPEEVSEVKEYESSDGTKGFRIFYVYDRSEPHLASLETDFDKIQTVVKSQKTQQVMADWLDRKAPNTFVRIDDEFKSCPLIQNQWVKRYKAQ